MLPRKVLGRFMPKYVLEPIDFSHPDWERSTHKDRCLVHAPDEEAAREYAQREFDIAARRRLGADVPLPPWTNPERVQAREIFSTGPYREGLIEIPGPPQYGKTLDDVSSLDDIADFDSSATWVAANAADDDSGAGGFDDPTDEVTADVSLDATLESETTSVGGGALGSAPLGTEPIAGGAAAVPREDVAPAAANGGEPDNIVTVNQEPVITEGDTVVTAGSPPSAGTAPTSTTVASPGAQAGEAAAEGSATTVSSHRVAQHVIQNRIVLRVHALNLLQFLDDLEAGGEQPTTNSHPLWGTSENEAELSALLREVRDELRRFNDLLEQNGPEPKRLEAVTNALGNAGKEFLNKFTSESGTLYSRLAAGALATFLVHLGYLDPNLALAAFGGEAVHSVAKTIRKSDG